MLGVWSTFLGRIFAKVAGEGNIQHARLEEHKKAFDESVRKYERRQRCADKHSPDFHSQDCDGWHNIVATRRVTTLTITSPPIYDLELAVAQCSRSQQSSPVARQSDSPNSAPVAQQSDNQNPPPFTKSFNQDCPPTAQQSNSQDAPPLGQQSSDKCSQDASLTSPTTGIQTLNLQAINQLDGNRMTHTPLSPAEGQATLPSGQQSSSCSPATASLCGSSVGSCSHSDVSQTLLQDGDSACSSTMPAYMYQGCHDLRELEGRMTEFHAVTWPEKSTFMRTNISTTQELCSLDSNESASQSTTPEPIKEELTQPQLNDIAVARYLRRVRRREQGIRQRAQSGEVLVQNQTNCDNAIASDSGSEVDSNDDPLNADDAFDGIDFDAPLTPPGSASGVTCTRVRISTPLGPGEIPALRTFPALRPAPTEDDFKEAAKHAAAEVQRNREIDGETCAAARKQARRDEIARQQQLARRREAETAKQRINEQLRNVRQEQARNAIDTRPDMPALPTHTQARVTRVDTPIPAFTPVPVKECRRKVNRPEHPNQWMNDLAREAAQPSGIPRAGSTLNGFTSPEEKISQQTRGRRWAWNYIVPASDAAKLESLGSESQSSGAILADYPGTQARAPWDMHSCW